MRSAPLPLIALATLALCACVVVPPPEAAQPAVPAKCQTDKLEPFLGRTLTAPLADEIRERSGSRSVRVIMPNMAVTLDYREDRLNIHVDDKSVVTKLTCG